MCDKEAVPITQDCKTMLAIDSLAQFIEEAYQTEGALFIMSCHYLIARTIITDPEAYGSKIALVGGGDEEFKKNSSVGNLKKIIFTIVMQKKVRKEKHYQNAAGAQGLRKVTLSHPQKKH